MNTENEMKDMELTAPAELEREYIYGRHGEGHGRHGEGEVHFHRGEREGRGRCGKGEKHGRRDRRWQAEDDSLSGLLRRCGHVLHHQGKAHGQSRVLKILSEEKQMSQKDLQDALGIRPGSVSELISKLEDKGLLRREKDDQDKRKAVLVLTPAGAEAAKVMPESEEKEHLYDALTQEEQETLRLLLKKLTASWAEKE
ncbi:MAG: MarR family winged helix-turn-helix transcriptional regulator [Candidatus Onthomonas sp.]